MKKVLLIGAFAFGAFGAMAQSESIQVTSYTPQGTVETRTETAPATSEGTIQKASTDHKSEKGMMGGCGTMSTDGKSGGCCSSKGGAKSSCGPKKK